MTDRTRSSCRRCAAQETCPSGGDGAPAGGRLAWMAAAHFLLPLVAAIVAAAAVEGQAARMAAAGVAFSVVLAAVAGAGVARRRRNQ